ncbi:hypothetical protein LOK49_LG01G02728 [Camellia lanceoleosa]|uniref:Uncharacterized protein n=1 Tax=Camellia lanceoleosa TaxID=1840588 RepID=A0ACC0IT06_9ERIC|nr:hypothetical protein LOK49_LG01G02728 [Camellia lanceoleosa]
MSRGREPELKRRRALELHMQSKITINGQVSMKWRRDSGIPGRPVRPANAQANLKDVFDLSSDVVAYEWAINTKYYTAHVSVWMAHLYDDFSIEALPIYDLDLLPRHSAHIEYRRRLQKLEESSLDPELSEYEISETEGVSLLGEEEPPSQIKISCLEWCTEHYIEYIEACVSNADLDRCLSVDGDFQGVERLYGALSAHMWPGMILKSFC